ncbi:MAG TPA: hypothetical protein VNX65_03195 [Patescibacteria group bacterium]|nr:hypothetical protein [Patescibacteria group bacterium]
MNRKLLTLSGLAVLLVSFTQTPVVPLYDGVGFPDEPYRYVIPPPDLPPTDKPTDASGSSTVQAGLNSQLLFPSSGEQGPQVFLYVPQHALSTQASAQSITLYARPHAPTIQPSNAKIAGNVYNLGAKNDSGGLVVTNGPTPFGTISLRSPQNAPTKPTIFYLASPNTWRPLETRQIGTDVYQADIIGLGDYALATIGDNKPAPKSQAYAFVLPTIIVGLITVGVVIIVIRRSNRAES